MTKLEVTARRKTMMPLAELLSNPLQPTYFKPSTSDELAQLAKNMAEHGQREPIHVMSPTNKAGLPGGTILDGHSRLAAAQDLGWTEIEVVIRHDLAGATDLEVETAFLEFNSNRRQLHPLDQAKIALRQVEIEQGHPRNSLRYWQSRKAVERVGKLLGQSGKNLKRYFAVLDAPIEIQSAFKDGEITLVLAARVGQLRKVDQSRLVREMKAIPAKDFKQHVHQFLAALYGDSPAYRRSLTAVALRWTKRLERDMPELEAATAQFYGPKLLPHASLMTRARQILDRLLIASEKPGAAQEEIALFFRKD